MKRKVVIAPLVVVIALLCSCASTPLQNAKLVADINHDLVVTAQKSAAQARANYLLATRADVEPLHPYLNDKAWAAFQKLEGQITQGQNIYIDSIALAEKYENVDDKSFQYYINLTIANQDSVRALILSVQKFLLEIGVNLGEVFGDGGS